MPTPLAHCRFRPVRVAVLPQPRGVAAEGLVREWLSGELGEAAEAFRFARGPHGRPELDRPGLDCNWSHSADRLAVAWGEGVRVGIDIEAPKPRPRAVELARRYFTPREAAALAALPVARQQAAFLRLWCAKEAVLKAHGRGLAFGLDRLCFDDPDGAMRLVAADPALGGVDAWRLEMLALDGLVGAVAWRAT